MKKNKDLVIEPNASLTDRKYTSEKQCYVMSADEYDRQVVDFQTVIDAVYCLGPALFYFPQSGILYYEGEPYSSKTPRWILK